MTSSSGRDKPGTAAAALLYWLLVVCGLAGITWLQLDARKDLFALWVGSLVGVAIGQGLALLRVRAWLILVATIGSLWFVAPLLVVVFEELFGRAAETAFLAFLPAAVCGYLSLTERGGLVAFWYPAVLWMLVILDGKPGAFDARGALPFALGLTALFIAFLRAKETRRAALWSSHADERLAQPLPRTVLQASPLRAAAQLAWSGAVGAIALVIAAWIAPSLWQKEQAKHEAQAAPHVPGSSPGGAEPCTPPGAANETRERIREYLPLLDGKDSHDSWGHPNHPDRLPPCPQAQSGSLDADGNPILPTHAGMWGSEPPHEPPAYADLAGSPATQPEPSYPSQLPSYTPSYTPTPIPNELPVPAAPPTPPPPAPKPEPAVAKAPAPHATSVSATRSPVPMAPVFVPQPTAAPFEPTVPCGGMLAICIGGLVLYVGARAARRQVTVRHLARPFWPETINQRISNQWEKMLIGLRDAGIHPRREEQPQAFARRIGIDGMTTCATILERVRHGVRVDAADLAEMHAATSSVYATARDRAGALGRAVGLFRWPLT